MSRIKQRFFIVCLSLALVVALFSGVFAVMGWGSLLGEVGSALIYPFQWLIKQGENGVTGFIAYFEDVQDLQEENRALQEENQALRQQLLENNALKMHRVLHQRNVRL